MDSRGGGHGLRQSHRIGDGHAHLLCFADGRRLPVVDLARWRCACELEFAGRIERAVGLAANSTGMQRTALTQ